MVRYRWDGRVQTLGINPFLVVPDQPAVAWTHTDETRLMPSIHDRTPYPAAAQLFFRGIVSIADSSRLMKAALVVCDLLTMVVLLAWLRDTGRSPWLVLVYAWNPLVILEIAHSGHIDALGVAVDCRVGVDAQHEPWDARGDRIRDCGGGQAAPDRADPALLEAHEGAGRRGGGAGAGGSSICRSRQPARCRSARCRT